MIEKWYRVLLWAYPRRFRRVRAQEMLTTLLDAARPGQRRPEWRDAANVVLRGLRYRFAVPRGAGYVSAAIVFALLCAVLVTAGVAFAAWRTAARAPLLPTALAVAGRAVPTRMWSQSPSIRRLRG